jgi:nicotinamidase-related amidase
MKTYKGIRIYETLSEIVAPEHTCLVVWDVQNGLVGRVFDKDTYVSRLTPFVNAMRERVPVVYTLITSLPQHVQSGWGLYSRMRRFKVDDPAKLTGFLAKGTVDAEISTAVTPHEGDVILDKTTANIFVDTPFETMMRNRGIQSIVFTGIATEMGIETSARDAAARGFYPVIVRDGVSSMDREAHERSLQSLERLAIVTDMKGILSAVG